MQDTIKAKIMLIYAILKKITVKNSSRNLRRTLKMNQNV
jgi:hypothetical protein